MMSKSLAFAILSILASPAAAIEVDGRVDRAEWAQAQEITDFRMTQPLSRTPASQITRAWLLATPEGLAVAFRNEQVVSMARTTTGSGSRTRRPSRRPRRRPARTR